MNFLTTEQCIESCVGAFLQFVHGDNLWAFAPDKVMRWAPASWPPKKEEEGLWKPIPYVWDFGARVLVPELWNLWLRQISERASSSSFIREVMEQNLRRSKDVIISMDETRGVLEKTVSGLSERFKTDSLREETDVFIHGRLEGNERKTLSVTSDHAFRGENLVFPLGDEFSSNIAQASEFICVWGFSVNGNQQMKLRKNDDGFEQPWWPLDFSEEVIPVNLRFDTCAPGGSMCIDVENVHDKPVDVVVKISGSRLVKKTT